MRRLASAAVEILAFLRQNPGASGREIRVHVKLRDAAILDVLAVGEALGVWSRERGPGRTELWSINIGGPGTPGNPAEPLSERERALVAEAARAAAIAAVGDQH